MPTVPSEEQGIGAPAEPSPNDWLGAVAGRMERNEKKAGLLEWLMGGAEEKPKIHGSSVLEQKGYPTPFDVESSKVYDLPYGDPAAPYLEAERASVRQVTMKEAQKFGVEPIQGGRAEKVTPEQADRIHSAWLAAERSPISKLGFNPGKTIESFDPRTRLTVMGLYDPKSDQMWYDATYPSAMVHESMHRGIKMLTQAGKLPEGLKNKSEEYLVRALMSKHFGDIEMGLGDVGDQQVKSARKFVPKEDMDKIEKAAADYIAEKRPRGPR